MGKKGKMKISKVKRNNQTTNKMRKQGKSKLHRHRSHAQKQGGHGGGGAAARPASPDSDARSDDEVPTDMLDEAEASDLLLRLQRQPALLSAVPTSEKPASGRGRRRRRSDSGASSADSDAEAAYARELARRPPKRARPLLPVKTRDGLQLRHHSEDESDTENEAEVASAAPSDDDGDSGVEGAPPDLHRGDEGGGGGAPLTALQLLAERRQRLRREKLRIGALCSALLENPEKRLKNLWAVVRLMDERTREGAPQLASVRRLAALSALEVFRDVLPEYAIRHQDYTDVKLKKETLALHKYEKELLEVYRRYLQRLERGTGPLRRPREHPADPRLPLACARCLCELLAARPHFNFASNIVASVVPLLQARDLPARRLVADACARVLADDERGDVSVEVVRRVARLARTRGDRLRPEALQCLLSLRAPDLHDDAPELRRRRAREEKHKKRIVNLSKNERKRAKKLREVERELQETSARESEAAHRRHLTEATRLLFHVYFRVLKGAPAPALLAAALDGVAAFVHAINVDYYSDLLAALAALGARTEGGGARTEGGGALRVARAALAALAGRGEALAADPTPFLDLVFRAFATLHHGAGADEVKVGMECVQAAAERARRLPVALPVALAKRAATAALQLGAGGALGALAALRRLAGPALLDGEPAPPPDVASGPRRYDPLASSAAQCGARAAVLHELSALRRHYHPYVRAAAAAPAAALPATLQKLSGVQLVERYEGAGLAFEPAVPPQPPAAARAPAARAPAAWASEELRTRCLALEAAAPRLADFTPAARPHRLG